MTLLMTMVTKVIRNIILNKIEANKKLPIIHKNMNVTVQKKRKRNS